jgi:hypothetical protein
MSWLSSTVDKVRGSVDGIGDRFTQALPSGMRAGSRTAFRYGVASMGGAMGIQYEYSRNKGMNSSEATRNAVTGGYNYAPIRAEQAQRQAMENADALLASQNRSAAEKEILDQRSAAFRAARRKQLAAANAASSATTLTGPSGLGDSSGGTAKTLLGA